jgi:hypothetical protein
MINKRNLITILGLSPIASLPIAASELSKFELQGWRPIETAPRDKVILLYAREGDLAGCNQRVAVGKYACSWTGATDKRERVLFELFQYTLDNGTNMARVVDASHWMPLPESPK